MLDFPQIPGMSSGLESPLNSSSRSSGKNIRSKIHWKSQSQKDLCTGNKKMFALCSRVLLKHRHSTTPCKRALMKSHVCSWPGPACTAVMYVSLFPCRTVVTVHTAEWPLSTESTVSSCSANKSGSTIAPEQTTSIIGLFSCSTGHP